MTNSNPYRIHRYKSKVREKLLKKKVPYEVGEVLICRGYFRMEKIIFQVNYEYTISGVQLDNLVLDDTHIVPIHLINNNFVYNYARTCHSFQGSSIPYKDEEDEHGAKVSNPMTIFDWRFTHVDRKWIYTSITRATDLTNNSSTSTTRIRRVRN